MALADIRKLTLLHSNDMHGDFLAEKLDEKLVGGVSMLSGYVNRTRTQEKNVLYAIAGDMFRGSIIDSEFRGVSTVDIMNMLAPDVACLGNHEFDYGIAHLLFLDRCTKFPIVNANLYIKTTGARLFNSHIVLESGGMRILFIGLVTEEVMTGAKSDMLLGTFVNVEDAAREAGRIINSYKTMDIDLTVLLTHIGFEEDKRLAAMLDPEWGVDLIIGGHSHTWLSEPAEVNGVLVVQAGTGTDCIGRFDLDIDCDTNSVSAWSWRLDPINDAVCPRDEDLERLITDYKSRTDSKYGRLITRFDRELTHPERQRETELGDLFADALRDMLGTDLVLLGSGSIRREKLGPSVTVQDMMEAFPYMGRVYAVKLTGAQLRRAFRFICRDEMLGGHTEFYQVPRNVRIVYDFASKELTGFTVNGLPVGDGDVFTAAIQEFHYNNITMAMGLREDEIPDYDKPRCVSTSDYDVIAEYLGDKGHLNVRTDGRITFRDKPENYG